jgi:uncharacterized membrane protein
MSTEDEDLRRDYRSAWEMATDNLFDEVLSRRVRDYRRHVMVWVTLAVCALALAWADTVIGTGDSWLPFTLMVMVAGGMSGWFGYGWIKARWELTELRNRRLDD